MARPKKDKQEVNYTPVAAMKDERCELCEHFRPLYNVCTKVNGHIEAKAWCELWEAKR